MHGGAQLGGSEQIRNIRPGEIFCIQEPFLQGWQAFFQEGLARKGDLLTSDVVGQQLFRTAVVVEIMHIHPDRFFGSCAQAAVEAKIPCHDVLVAIHVNICHEERLPPTLVIADTLAYERPVLPEVDLYLAPVCADHQIGPTVAVHILPDRICDHPRGQQIQAPGFRDIAESSTAVIQ